MKRTYQIINLQNYIININLFSYTHSYTCMQAGVLERATHADAAASSNLTIHREEKSSRG
jgi:hypothetical protein